MAADMGDNPLSGSMMIGTAATPQHLSPVSNKAPTIQSRSTGNDYQAELQRSVDPNKVLAGWCVEGRPRVTAALADEGSILRLAAQLLCETNFKSFGAAVTEKESPEVLMLKAAFNHKIGHSAEAAIEFRSIAQSPSTPSRWKRRAYAALGWVLAFANDYRSSIRSVSKDGLCDPGLDEYDRFSLLIASARIRSEVGDPQGARAELMKAKETYANFATLTADARVPLAEARVCFSEGDIDNAAKLWHSQTPSKPTSVLFPPHPEENVSSWLAAFAIAAIVGDLGDFIVEGSRWARHEAANNFAVCALHAGRLDGAITALEEVMKSFGAPTVVDSVAACNLKTLYELCRTPESMRLIN
jgi:tetratricopeptide (TPR) repeat protein